MTKGSSPSTGQSGTGVLQGLVNRLSDIDQDELVEELEGQLSPLIAVRRISSEQGQEIVDQFKEAIIKHISTTVEQGFKDLKEAKGKMFERMLASEHAINFLDVFIDFKDKIDKIVPFDIVLPILAQSFIPLVAAYAPVIAVVLERTGLPSKTVEFFKDENLHTLRDNLRDRLAERNLASQAAVVEQVASLLPIEVSAESLSRIGISGKTATPEMVAAIESTPKIPDFLEELTRYADTTALHTKADINKDLDGIQQSITQNLEALKLSKKEIQNITEQLKEPFKEARNVLLANTKELNNLGKPVTIFDKMENQQKAADTLSNCLRKLPAIVGKHEGGKEQAIITAITQEVNREVRGLQGNAAEIGKMIKSDHTVKNFAEKQLGAGKSNIVAVERMASPSRERGV